MYEILYLIYFHVDDYETACNFWLLNKYFTKNYMDIYNKNYEHKFKLLTYTLDNVLQKVTINDNDNENDNSIQVYKFNYCLDLKFCYQVYKKTLIDNFIKCDFDYNRKCSWCSLLIYHIFREGFHVLNKIYKIKCVQNKIILIPKFKNKTELMEKITCLNKLNGYCINKYKQKIEDVLN